MFNSLLLTIYILFLITYIIVMGFAVYRVYAFCQNKEFAGYSKKISLAIIVFSLLVILFSFGFINNYKWDDNTAFWAKKIVPAGTSGMKTPGNK